MYARSSTFRGRPQSVDAGIEFVRREVLPTILVMDGCVGLSMVPDSTPLSSWRMCTTSGRLTLSVTCSVPRQSPAASCAKAGTDSAWHAAEA